LVALLEDRTVDTAARIEKFLLDIRRRNRREVIVGIILLPVFGLYAARAPSGSLGYFAHIIIMLAILFVIGVFLTVARPRGNLIANPPTDLDHWSTEVRRQARLLRRVPLWYLGPFLPGFVLLLWSLALRLGPKGWLQLSVPAAVLLVLVLVFGGIAWLNLRAASTLEAEADALRDPLAE